MRTDQATRSMRSLRPPLRSAPPSQPVPPAQPAPPRRLSKRARKHRARTRRRLYGFRAVAILLVVVAMVSSWFGTKRPTPAAGSSAGVAAAGFATSAFDPCAPARLSGPKELRGMWLTSVSNSDFPSKPGLSEAQIKQEYIGWLNLAQKLNHNAIFVHVRPSGDAFWPSDYVPWSYWLTGRTDGIGPGWDPMRFMVDETHKRGLEFHAWFNPYKASQEGAVADLPATHVLRSHPDWAVGYPATGSGRRLYYDPGNPDARTYVEDSILEVVRKYDVDGIHFDDFFYPYPSGRQAFPDGKSFALYGRGEELGDWRRDNVNTFVREMDSRIKTIKPWVKFGISPFGIWRNSDTDSRGSKTSGLQAYDAIYADTRKWVQEGWLDYIVPQLYWNIGFKVADYAILLKWWTDLTTNSKVQLYIGQADYRIGQSGPWKDPAELDRQIALNQAAGVDGSVHFTARNLRSDPLGAVTRYRDNHNATLALVPPMGAGHPASPSNPVVRQKNLTWSAGGGPAPVRYAVYRADTPESLVRLVATIPATDSPSWTDPNPVAADHYCVAALDRLWNASPASHSVTALAVAGAS